MNDTKEPTWDEMFSSPEEKAAAYQALDHPKNIIPEDDDSTPESHPRVPESRTRSFQEKLEYVHDWSQRELLGLLIDQIQLSEVSFDFLDHWRTNYQVPPE